MRLKLTSALATALVGLAPMSAARAEAILTVNIEDASSWVRPPMTANGRTACG